LKVGILTQPNGILGFVVDPNIRSSLVHVIAFQKSGTAFFEYIVYIGRGRLSNEICFPSAGRER